MKRRTRSRLDSTAWLVVAVGLAGTVLCGAATPAFADTIRTTSGASYENVEVIRATWENVSYKLNNIPQSVDGNKVKTLERSSDRLGRIYPAIRKGNFKTALDYLDDATRFGKEWEKAEASYLRGKVLMQAAGNDADRLEEAVKAFKEYLQQYGPEKDFYVPHATYSLGIAYLRAGKPDEAKKQFEELARFGGGKGLWGFRKNLGLAQAIVEGKSSSQELLEARRLLQEVINDRSTPTEVKQEATVLRARVFVKQSQFPQARELLERSFLDSGAYSEQYAAACVVMGDTYRLEGGKSNLQEAELWYLRATLFGKSDQRTFQEAAASLVNVYAALGMDGRASEWKGRLERASGGVASNGAGGGF